MAQKLAVYKCTICGNVAEVLTAGGADLMCCGQQMNLQAENTTDAAVEKHIPVYGGKYIEYNIKQNTANLLAESEKYDHILFYAHGGLNSPKDSARRILAMKETFKKNMILLMGT